MTPRRPSSSRRAKVSSGRSREASGSDLGGSWRLQRLPRAPQESPRSAPGGAPEGQHEPQEAPNDPQEGQNEPQEGQSELREGFRERFGKDFRAIYKQRDATETLPTQIAGEGA